MRCIMEIYKLFLSFFFFIKYTLPCVSFSQNSDSFRGAQNKHTANKYLLQT